MDEKTQAAIRDLDKTCFYDLELYSEITGYFNLVYVVKALRLKLRDIGLRDAKYFVDRYRTYPNGFDWIQFRSDVAELLEAQTVFSRFDIKKGSDWDYNK